MIYRRTAVSLIFICLSLSCFCASSYGQDTPSAVYDGLEFFVSKAEMVDWDPSNSYILIILKINNTGTKTVRFMAKYGRELSLDDDLGKHYYGAYAQNIPASGLGISPGEQQKVAFAFQKPDLNCSMFTMSFSKNDLQGLERSSGSAQDDGSIRIPIPVKRVLVWPKAKDRHESDFKKEININGLIFIVNEAFIWRRPVRNDTAASPSPPASPASLGITFDLINTLMTNRVDAEGNFTFSMADDIGNKYKIVKPSGYSRQLKVLPERFPRIYPRESYRETVFFEPPSDEAKFLMFTIDASAVGISKEISIRIPAEEIAR
jgi:hypothetical protein